MAVVYYKALLCIPLVVHQRLFHDMLTMQDGVHAVSRSLQHSVRDIPNL